MLRRLRTSTCRAPLRSARHNVAPPTGFIAEKPLIEHNSELCLSGTTASAAFRLPKIVATFGPACDSPDMVERMIRAGVDVARFNMSHSTHEIAAKGIENVRATQRSLGRYVGVALDTKGPEVRLGFFGDDEARTFSSGQYVNLTVDPALKNDMTTDLLFVDYAPLIKETGLTSVLIADGALELHVLERDLSAGVVKCVVTCGATIKSHSNVFLPGVDVNLPAVGENDEKDLVFGVDNNVDFIFASFVRSPTQIHEMRGVLGARGRDIAIIAKIESRRGVENLDDIVKTADGVMVARGDLGVHTPMERMFLAQKRCIATCNIHSRPVICATQMLESMTHNRRPTRAEATDVANAVIDGADCLMLSGESAHGDYPAQTVETLGRIATEAQCYVRYGKRFKEMIALAAKSPSRAATMGVDSMASATVLTSMETSAKCILTATVSGNSIAQLRRFGPKCPIVTVCATERCAQRMTLHKGVIPLYFPDIPYTENFDKLMTAALEKLKSTQDTHAFSLASGDRVVIMCTDVSQDDPNEMASMQIRVVA